MKCLKPIEISPLDCHEEGYFHRVFIPCGKCEACRNADSNSWRIRLKEHFYSSENAFFITLTYNDNNLPCCNFTNYSGKNIQYNPVCRQDVQKFFKRLRRDLDELCKKQGRKMSYFLVSEYGPNSYRPHYHFLLFNIPDLSPIPEVNEHKITEKIESCWGKGFIKLDKCNENRIAYCTKYMSCETVIPDYYIKPFRLISKGIGISYLNKTERIIWHKNGINNYYPDGIYKNKLPRYYKDKIFSEDERLIIRQLNYLRNNIRYRSIAYQLDNIDCHIDEMKRLTDIQKNFKRIYKNKSLKTRKDL